MIEDVDKFARDLPRLTLHGNIPTATTMALAARVVELLEIVEENVPLPWCPVCKMECERVDDRLCCLVCETEVISPTSHHVARVAELEQHSAILLQLIDRGFTDAPGMGTATDEMIADGVVPEGWSIYDVKTPSEQGEPRG